MFRKPSLVSPALAILLIAAPALHAGYGLSLRQPRLEAARAETYPERSGEPTDAVKRAVFERINRDRREAGLAPVAWDEAASRVADHFCAAQVAEKTRGHFLMDGIPPYARMAFAGIFGMPSENSVSWITTAAAFTDPIEKLALDGHDEMMKEKEPFDGHRRTILDPAATHVGVGYAAEHGRFQMAQEFLTRQLARLSLSLRRGGVSIEGRPLGQQVLKFVTIAPEPPPQRLSREEASSRSSYSFPQATLAYIPEGYQMMKVVGTANEDRLKIRTDRSFSFDFSAVRPGLYTFLFYVAPAPGAVAKPGGSAVLWFD